MKKIISIFMLLLHFVVSDLYAQTAPDAALARLRDRYGVRFVYDAALADAVGRETAGVELPATLSLEEALDRIFTDSGIAWQVRGRSVILKAAPARQAAPRIRRVTLSGHITDAASGETLIGAGILTGTVGTVTNEFGFYSLTLPAGNYQFKVSHLGFSQQDIAIDLQRDSTLNFALSGNNELAAARIVERKDAGLHSVYPGSTEVPLRRILDTPALLGEADVLKSLQLLPGIQTGMQGFTGLHVRGGGAEENLVMLDGIPLYGIDHMLGLFSVFQPEAVKDVTLYKGAFPARYGGRISSVLDVRTNEGNLRQTEGSFTIGTTSERFHLEGPIIRDRLSYSVSARALHSLLVSPILALALRNQEEKVNFFYYDLNARLNWILGDRDRMHLILYHGNDHLVMDGRYEMNLHAGDTFTTREDHSALRLNWGNTVAALRWNHLFGSRLHASTTAAFNRYGTGLHFDSDELVRPAMDHPSVFSLRYASGIRDWSLRTDFDWTPVPEHLVRFGAGWTHHLYRPAVMDATQYQEGTEPQAYRLVDNDDYPGTESFVYAEDNIALSEQFSVNPGLHLAWFRTRGRDYLSLQPRLSLRYAPGEGWAVKAAYARMAQYVHQLTASTLTLPLDLWAPVTEDIPPVTADQYTLGLYWDGLPDWEFSIEGYLKRMDNLLAYRDGSLLILNNNRWEEQVSIGQGRARGIEFYAARTRGKTTGSLSYTLARSTRIFPDGSINLGHEFPDKYDRRHTVSLSVSHRFSERWDMTANWTFATGGAASLPLRQTQIPAYDSSGPRNHGDYLWRHTVETVDYTQGRNNFRLPPTHRLNLGLNLHRRTRRGNEACWTFTLYNAYNARTPDLVVLWQDYQGGEQTRQYLKALTYLPILPSVSYTCKF